MPRRLFFRRRALLRCRRSSIALMTAFLAPVLAGAIALGVEVSDWSVEQARMQRTADAAAVSGAVAYNATGNTQTAATAAAKLAEVNGISGSPSPTWNSASKTLSDNNVTVQVVSGVKNASDTALQVSVTESVPLTVARVFSSHSSVPVQATSTAELIATTTAGTGGQPCMLALQTGSGNVGIGASGSIAVQAPGCTLRSNSQISFAGGGTFTTAGLYAGSTISIPSWVTLNGGGEYPNHGTITDPYAANTTLQNALTAAASASGSSIACYNQNCGLPSSAGSTFNGSYCSGQGTGTVTCYLKPGNYGNWTALGGGPYYFNLSPGLYVFNGKVDLENYTVTNGTAVTVLVTGTFKGTNTFDFTLTAPGSTQASSTGGVAGIALAGSGSTVTLSGNPQFYVTGVVYFPNAAFNDANSPQLGNSSGSCLEIIAYNFTLSGNINLQSGCSSVNAQSFASTPGSTTYKAALVQ